MTVQNSNISIAIIGTGALGGYYGARLAHAGFETHFVLHSDYQHVQKHGLKVESIHGDFSIPSPSIWPDVESLPPCDILCLSLKSTANAAILPYLKSKVKPHGVLLVLQNGLGIEETVFAHTQATVIGGLCFLCSNKVGPGHIRHIDYGDIRLGALQNDSQHTMWLERLQDIFTKSGIGIHRAKNLRQARWQKLVWNIPFNGLSVVLQADTQQMMQEESGRALAEALMREVVQAANADGCSIDNTFIERMLADTERMAPYLPSMRLDYDRHQKMEIEAIYSAPIDIASQVGYSMTLTRQLRDQLIFLQIKQRHFKENT